LKKKFAFILMGNHYTPEVHKAVFETENQVTYICTIKSFNEMEEKIKYLMGEGVGAIELCGAFGKEKADEVVKMTDNKVAVGYIIHDPSLDPLFKKFFGN